MKEEMDFSKFIDKRKIKTFNEEGLARDTVPEFTLNQDTRKAVARGVLDGEYLTDPYITEDKTMRMRVRDQNKKIIYDDTLAGYIELNRTIGVHISTEELKALYDVLTDEQ